jgi:hypothetical protein
VNIENVNNEGRKINPKSSKSISGFTGAVYSGDSEYKFWYENNCTGQCFHGFPQTFSKFCYKTWNLLWPG